MTVLVYERGTLREVTMVNKLRFIDLYAGIGGFRYGIEQSELKAECVWSCEIDKYARQVYKKHWEEPEASDVQNKAYWLGFITGDGGTREYELKIRISEKEHLESFKDDIGSEHKISKRSDGCYELGISRKKVVDDLISLGIVSDKCHKNISLPEGANRYLDRKKDKFDKFMDEAD